MFGYHLRFCQEGLVVFVGHEADFHAFLLIRRPEFTVTGDVATLGLFQATKGHERVFELVLLEGKEKVALIFVQVAASFEQHAVPGLVGFDPSVVPRGHFPGAEFLAALDERAEFELLIAHHTGIWRSSGAILGCEILNDLLLKVLSLIHQIEWDAESVGYAAGIHHGLWATALVFGTGEAILRPQFERDAYDIVALFLQQGGRGG